MKPYPYTRRYNDRGVVRIEYRRYGRTVALTGEPGTMEFQQSYEAAKARLDGATIVPREDGSRPEVVKHGTFRWLCVEWFKSPEFGQLAPSTQVVRRQTLEHILMEPAHVGSSFLFGQYPVAVMEAKHIKVIRDRRKDKPDAANNRLKYLRVVFQWGIDNNIGGMRRNVARDVPSFKNPTEGHHCWTDAEREQFKARHPVGTMARLAYELFFQTGQRIGDVWGFGPGNIINGALVFTQEKNHRRKPVHLELPIQPELKAALDATKTGSLRFLVNAYGDPFASKKSFANWFKDRCLEAGLPGKCSAHGIRKATATHLANSGATSPELMASMGWGSLRSAEPYIRTANQRQLASRAMGRVSDKT